MLSSCPTSTANSTTYDVHAKHALIQVKVCQPSKTALPLPHPCKLLPDICINAHTTHTDLSNATLMLTCQLFQIPVVHILLGLPPPTDEAVLMPGVHVLK